MKFWDTIAKMCGVQIVSIRDSNVPRYGDGRVVREFTVKRGDSALCVDMTRDDVVVRFNGHGLRLRDSTRFANQTKRGTHIGLIDIERIRPMTSKSADAQPLREAAEMLAKAAERIRTEKPTVLS